MVRVLTRGSARQAQILAWCAAAATAVACGGKALDVGSDEPTATAGGPGAYVPGAGSQGAGAQPGAGGGTTNGTRLSPEELAAVQWPEATECNAAPDSPLVGTWKGRWPEALPSDAEVVLTIVGLTPEGVPCGTLTIGEGPLPPPVADAEAIYPPAGPSGSAGTNGNGPGGVGPPIMYPWPGYPYELLKVASSGTRLAFQISYGEILRPWCQLQQAYPDSFSCLPEWTSGSGDSSGCTISGPNLPETSVPCFKMQYCASYTCFCYDGECDAAIQGTAFELHWDGPALEGSVNGTGLLFLDPVQ